MEVHHSSLWNWKGDDYRFDIYISDSFDDLKSVKQVYALVLSKDKKKILIAYGLAGIWTLPGGRVEPGETLLQTLGREVKEESNRDIEISTAKPLFYQNSYKKLPNGEWEFVKTEVRYTVDVKNDLEFVADPDRGKITEARWVDIKDLGDYLKWGETTEMIKELLMR